MTNDGTQQECTKRPFGVWLIAAFTTLSVLWVTYSTLMIYVSTNPLMQIYREYFAALPIWEHVAAVTIACLNIAGAIFLFQLRRQASVLFLVSFILGVTATAFSSVPSDIGGVVGSSAKTGAIGGHIIGFLIVLYAFNLRGRGLLR